MTFKIGFSAYCPQCSKEKAIRCESEVIFIFIDKDGIYLTLACRHQRKILDLNEEKPDEEEKSDSSVERL
jgi:hypothetical protein